MNIYNTRGSEWRGRIQLSPVGGGARRANHSNFSSDTLIGRTLHRHVFHAGGANRQLTGNVEAGARYRAVQCGVAIGRMNVGRARTKGASSSRDDQSPRKHSSLPSFTTHMHTHIHIDTYRYTPSSRAVEIARQPQDYWLNERESTRTISWRGSVTWLCVRHGKIP